jgi:hypothetical protein
VTDELTALLEKKCHDQQNERLNKLYSALQNRIDRMYMDKLDDKISENIDQEHLERWRAEQENILVGRNQSPSECQCQLHRKGA